MAVYECKNHTLKVYTFMWRNLKEVKKKLSSEYCDKWHWTLSSVTIYKHDVIIILSGGRQMFDRWCWWIPTADVFVYNHYATDLSLRKMITVLTFFTQADGILNVEPLPLAKGLSFLVNSIVIWERSC